MSRSLTPNGTSRIAFGCGLLGGDDWGSVDEADAVAAVRTALSAGVTMFDTADVYGLGRSESRLAAALGSDIGRVTVITKGGVAWDDEPGQRAKTRKDLSLNYLRTAAQASSRRLGLERLPVYLAHWPDHVHSVTETVEALVQLRREGLVDRIGVSNFPAAELLTAGALDRLDVVELGHSLLAPQFEELDILRAAGRSVLIYGALGQGFLTGKYSRDHRFAPTDQRHRLEHFVNQSGQHQTLLSELRSVAADLGISQGQTAVRWAMSTAPGCAVIVGARTPAQASENARAADVELSPEHLARLNAVATCGSLSRAGSDEGSHSTGE